MDCCGFGFRILNVRFLSFLCIYCMFIWLVRGVKIFMVLWVFCVCFLGCIDVIVCMLCRWLVSLIKIMCRLCDIVINNLWKFLVCLVWVELSCRLVSLVMLLISLVILWLKWFEILVKFVFVFLIVLCSSVVISVVLFIC